MEVREKKGEIGQRRGREGGEGEREGNRGEGPHDPLAWGPPMS